MPREVGICGVEWGGCVACARCGARCGAAFCVAGQGAEGLGGEMLGGRVWAVGWLSYLERFVRGAEYPIPKTSP